MVPIIIDISGVQDRLFLSGEEMKSYAKYVLDGMGNRYMQLWTKQVTDNLHQTQGAYITGMPTELKYVDDFTLEIVLDGKGQSKLAIMIENGANAWDMKEAFSKSSKIKHNKAGGWYLTIPFRFATSEAIAQSAVFANQMPPAVQKVAKALGADESIKTSDLPVEFQVKGVRKEINQGGKTFPEYKHKDSIYTGIQHNTTPNQGGYINFRRVGENSDKNSWVHKGFQPHHFMEKALDQLSRELPDILHLADEQFLENR
jgi:hypothetical protein